MKPGKPDHTQAARGSRWALAGPGASITIYDPKVVVQHGRPKVTFSPGIPRHLFDCPMKWAVVKKCRWPAQANDTPEGLEAAGAMENARESGYWRKDERCLLHPRQEGHFCWERSAVEDLLRAKGYTDQIPEIPTLEALKNLTPYLAQDWTKQLIYLSKMRKLYLACVEAGIHGEEKWDEEHQRLHESTWPATREVIGLPPENIEALKTWRTSKPAPVYESKLEADLAPYVLQDYPEGETIPPHIGTWLSSRVASFEGQDPNYLHCFYNRGKPDLEYTRQVVMRHRLQKTRNALLECALDGTIRIPSRWAENVSPETFRGDTVEGLSQVLAEHLGFPSDKGEPEGFPVLVAWAAAKLGNRLSEEYKNVSSGT